MALARDVAKFPQVCLRSDRRAAYEQWQLDLEAALRSEFHRGMQVSQSGSMSGGLDTFAKTRGHQGALRHFVLGTPMQPPFPAGMETALFAMGGFWSAERRFWQATGVYTTAVGHVDGPNGQTEAVRVVYDPTRTSYEALLALFWEGHDPTAAANRQQASRIYWTSPEQRRAAEASRRRYQPALTAAGCGSIVTEIVEAPELHYAEESQQQYLAKDPSRHAAGSGTGVSYPAGTSRS
jgi:peptide-methionine (S)-S-oxide reductase